MRPLRPLLVGALLATAVACDQVDYIEIKPETLVLRHRSAEIWLQGHAKSHTGVYYSRKAPGWAVKDDSIARVDATGKLTALKSGRTEVVATVGKVSAAAPVEVLFAEKIVASPSSVQLVEGGPSTELSVQVYDYLGRELRDRTATFRSLDEKIVSMGQNAAFPMAPGATQVVVMVEDQKLTVEVTVEPEKKAAKKKK